MKVLISFQNDFFQAMLEEVIWQCMDIAARKINFREIIVDGWNGSKVWVAVDFEAFYSMLE